MPPSFLTKLPTPSKWNDTDALRWANELRVSCDALGIALKEAALINEATSKRIRRLRVPRGTKIDPELPENLTTTQRERKTRLLELGLSDFYVGLCFEALYVGVISVRRLAEVELLESRTRLGKGELSSIAFAMKIGHAIITDDKEARKLAETSGHALTQTTPHLFAWLIFKPKKSS